MQRIYSTAVLALFLCSAACASDGLQNGPNAGSSSAQSGSDRGQDTLQLQGGKVTVEYGRPALRGRDLEKEISPGDEWRMGSNAATTLTTDVDLKFGDKVVPRGKYVLKARLEAQEKWTLIVLRDETTVAEVPMSFQRVGESAELLTIDLQEAGNGGRLLVHWGKLTISTDFQKA